MTDEPLPTGVPADAPALDAPMTAQETSLWRRERVKVHGRFIGLMTLVIWLPQQLADVFRGQSSLGAALASVALTAGVASVAMPLLMESKARTKWLKAHRLRRALLE